GAQPDISCHPERAARHKRSPGRESWESVYGSRVPRGRHRVSFHPRFVPSLQDSASFITAYPGLKRWAILFRPASGTSVRGASILPSHFAFRLTSTLSSRPRTSVRVEGPAFTMSHVVPKCAKAGPSTPRPPDPQDQRVGKAARSLRS